VGGAACHGDGAQRPQQQRGNHGNSREHCSCEGEGYICLFNVLVLSTRSSSTGSV
jgi:hypothetical protein